MNERLLVREWLGVGIVLGAILTTLIVSRIAEKRIYKVLEAASQEAHLLEKSRK